jgi:SAM-dependent methyltransferase
MPEIPTRITWAVKQLEVVADDVILEVGCGDGLALNRIAMLLDTGHIVGVDRAETAIRAAGKRNQDGLKSGKVSLIRSEIADLEPTERFAKVFAVNVDVFWHRPRKELSAIRDLLLPDGRLFLMYEPPSSDHLDKISELTRRNLEANGYSVIADTRAKLKASAGLLITAVSAAAA